MTIFRNASGYAPLIPNLESYWDKTLAELPEELRKIVEKRFFISPWDSLDVANRRNIAAQQDYQHDPNHEPVTYFELLCFADELKGWIEKARQDSKDAVALVLRDVADRLEKILEDDRERVGTEIQGLRALQARCDMQAEQRQYSTMLIGIQQAAIHEFFEPRRIVDPKKPDVVEWIKAKMIAAGMDSSENVAEAIFTIIKPSDHNPRKRRG